MLPEFTDAGSTRSENLKRSCWFSAISETAHPVCVQPRSQLMMQKDWPSMQRMRTDEVWSVSDPPEHPAATSRASPERREVMWAVRMGKQEGRLARKIWKRKLRRGTTRLATLATPEAESGS